MWPSAHPAPTLAPFNSLTRKLRTFASWDSEDFRSGGSISGTKLPGAKAFAVQRLSGENASAWRTWNKAQYLRARLAWKYSSGLASERFKLHRSLARRE